MRYLPNAKGKCPHGHDIICPLKYGQSNETVYWHKKKNLLNNGQWECKKCNNIINSKCRTAHLEAARERQRKYYYKHQEIFKKRRYKYDRLRKEKIMKWYNFVCRCCRENQLDFLTLDHINDDGAKQRKLSKNRGGNLYAKILSLGYAERPKDLQILCANCQLGKRINKGFCFHHPEIDLRIPENIK